MNLPPPTPCPGLRKPLTSSDGHPQNPAGKACGAKAGLGLPKGNAQPSRLSPPERFSCHWGLQVPTGSPQKGGTLWLAPTFQRRKLRLRDHTAQLGPKPNWGLRKPGITLHAQP